MPNNVYLILLNLLCCFFRRSLPVAARLASYVEIDAITMALSTYAFILYRLWLASRSSARTKEVPTERGARKTGIPDL